MHWLQLTDSQASCYIRKTFFCHRCRLPFLCQIAAHLACHGGVSRDEMLHYQTVRSRSWSLGHDRQGEAIEQQLSSARKELQGGSCKHMCFASLPAVVVRLHSITECPCALYWRYTVSSLSCSCRGQHDLQAGYKDDITLPIKSNQQQCKRKEMCCIP